MKPLGPLRQFLSSSGKLALLYAGSTALTFAVGVALARMLGASGYGVYALAMLAATMVGMITEFGLPVLAMREVGKARATGEWGELAGLLRWSDRFILGLSALVLVATVVPTTLLVPVASQDPAWLWAALLVPFAAIGKLRSFVLLAMDHVFSSQFPVMILRPALFLAGCGLVWAVMGDLAPASALAAQAASAVVVMVLMLALWRRHKPAAMREALPTGAVRDWLVTCAPMGMTEGLRLLQGQMALLLVGSLAGAAQAGIYRVADAVAQIALVLSSVAGTAATPMFARLWSAGDREGLERLAAVGAWLMLGGVLAIGALPAMFGDFLFPFVFGAEFAACGPVFLALWAGAAAMAGFGLCLTLANMTGHHVLATQSFGIIAAVNLALGLVLVPMHGALGGALASAVAACAGGAWCSWRLWRVTRINPTVFNRHGWTIALGAWRLLRRG